MGNKSRKRHHAQLEEAFARLDRTSDTVGVAATLAHLRAPNGLDYTNTSPPNVSHEDGSGSGSGEWTVVARGRKRQKKSHGAENKVNEKGKSKNTYPTLVYAELHKLQSSIKIGDLQGLVLYCLADGTSPQWVSVQSHTAVKKAVVLFVPGLEKGMFDGSISLEDSTPNEVEAKESTTVGVTANGHVQANPALLVASKIPSHEDAGYKRVVKSPDDYLPFLLASEKLPLPLKPLADMFKHLWPVKAPGDDKFSKVHSPLHAMLTAHITKSQEAKKAEKEKKGSQPSGEGRNWENKRTSIAEFLTSKEDLQDNEYTLHPVFFIKHEEKLEEFLRRHDAKQTEESGWVDTLVNKLAHGEVPEGDIEKGSLTAGRSILAIDCEMCKVEGDELALTRISLVDWEGSVVMDELVKPDKPIIDYLTAYSGITPEKLAPVTTALADVQKRLLDLLDSHTIILGHSLNADLTALKMTHPFIIDTTILYQHPRGPPLKSSLKWLSQKYLSREIQKGHGIMGHDSIEDAKACLDLVKLKCEKGPKWGTSEAAGESIFKRLARTPKAGSSSTHDGTAGKSGAVIDHGAPERNFGTMASFCKGCADDAEVVEGVKRAVLGDPDGRLIPGGGVDFTWARLRDLEALRGWSNDNRHPTKPPIPSSDYPVSPTNNPSPTTLSSALSRTITHIASIRSFLPPCTLLVVYSGTGDPREMGRLHEMQRTFKREYASKKWDELSVKWTDTEEQALRQACRRAREGVGFVGVV